MFVCMCASMHVVCMGVHESSIMHMLTCVYTHLVCALSCKHIGTTIQIWDFKLGQDRHKFIGSATGSNYCMFTFHPIVLYTKLIAYGKEICTLVDNFSSNFFN